MQSDEAMPQTRCQGRAPTIREAENDSESSGHTPRGREPTRHHSTPHHTAHNTHTHRQTHNTQLSLSLSHLFLCFSLNVGCNRTYATIHPSLRSQGFGHEVVLLWCCCGCCCGCGGALLSFLGGRGGEVEGRGGGGTRQLDEVVWTCDNRPVQ